MGRPDTENTIKTPEESCGVEWWKKTEHKKGGPCRENFALFPDHAVNKETHPRVNPHRNNERAEVPLGYRSLSMPTRIQFYDYQEHRQRSKSKEGRKPSVILRAFWIT